MIWWLEKAIDVLARACFGAPPPGPGEARVVRVLVVEGKREWVERTLERSYVDTGRPVDLPAGTIHEVYRHTNLG